LNILMGDVSASQGCGTNNLMDIGHLQVYFTCSSPLIERGTGMGVIWDYKSVNYSYKLAFFKAELAADNALPLEGKVFMSIRDEDKPALVQIAKKIADAGLEIIATSGTLRYLSGKGSMLLKLRRYTMVVLMLLTRCVTSMSVWSSIHPQTGRATRTDGGYGVQLWIMLYPILLLYRRQWLLPTLLRL